MIIATQPEKDCGTSLTNVWCQEFIEVLSDLPAIKAAGEGTTLRRFEHYDREDGSALSKYWQSQLPKAERTILSVLTTAPRRVWTKAQLAAQTGYEPSGGGFNNALSRLRTLLLIDGKTDLIASERLFDE